MVDFRKLLPALAIIALSVIATVPANAQVGVFSCVANAGVPPLVRSEGITELTGDIILNCQGNAPVPIIANIQIFLNTQITSRILNTGTGATEALLFLDDMIVPATSADGPGTPDPNNGYRRGLTVAANPNSLVWLGVPVVPTASPNAFRTIRITNVRANASGVPGSGSLIPAQITAFISISAATSVPVNNPQQVVAFVQQGLTSAVTSLMLQQCFSQNTNLNASGTNVGALRFTEGFATAFKPRLLPGQENILGSSFNSESGTVITGNPAGVADTSTRLRAQFTNVPAGVTLYVTTVNVATTGAGATATATLVSGGSGASTAAFPGTTVPGIGTSPAFSQTSNWTPLAVSGGTAEAIWEITNAPSGLGGPNPFAIETLHFGVLFSYTANPGANLPGLGITQVTQTFAPLSTVVVASATAPIPRFTPGDAAPRNLFTINACVTNLLFPFVTNVAGFDTGLAISNTSLDSPVFATSPQTGNCTIYYFGTGPGGSAAPAAQTTTTPIAGGQVLVFTLFAGGSNGIQPTPGFQGYIIARCAFQYAHGFAFVSDLGASRLAMGYLALVIPDTGARGANPFPAAGGGSGEQLGH